MSFEKFIFVAFKSIFKHLFTFLFYISCGVMWFNRLWNLGELSFRFQIYFVFPFQNPQNAFVQYRPHLIFQVYSESEAADAQVTGGFDELFIF